MSKNTTFQTSGGGGSAIYIDPNPTLSNTYNINGGTLGTTGALRIKTYLGSTNIGSGGGTVTITCSYGGTVVGTAVMTHLTSSQSLVQAGIEFFLVANNSATAQKGFGNANGYYASGGGSGLLTFSMNNTTLSINSATAQNLTVVATTSNASTVIEAITIEKL